MPRLCAPPTHQRRQPEGSVLYRIVQAHLDTFLARTAGDDGEDLPSFVTRELRAYLRCGLLEHGCPAAFQFFRLTCTESTKSGPKPDAVSTRLEALRVPGVGQEASAALIPGPRINLVLWSCTPSLSTEIP